MEVTIATWRCSCGYSQDVEPTQENMNLHFNDDRNFPLTNVGGGQCPSCLLTRKQVIEFAVSQKIQIPEAITILNTPVSYVDHKGVERTRKELSDEQAQAQRNFHTNGKPNALPKETDPSKKSQVRVMTVSELDADIEDGFTPEEEIVETDRYVEIAGVKHPIKEKRQKQTPKVRKRTPEERAAKLADIQAAETYWQSKAE